jgi:hypothetical protein
MRRMRVQVCHWIYGRGDGTVNALAERFCKHRSAPTDYRRRDRAGIEHGLAEIAGPSRRPLDLARGNERMEHTVANFTRNSEPCVVYVDHHAIVSLLRQCLSSSRSASLRRRLYQVKEYALSYNESAPEVSLYVINRPAIHGHLSHAERHGAISLLEPSDARLPIVTVIGNPRFEDGPSIRIRARPTRRGVSIAIEGT